MKPSSIYLWLSGAFCGLSIGALAVQDLPGASKASLFILCLMAGFLLMGMGINALDKEGES